MPSQTVTAAGERTAIGAVSRPRRPPRAKVRARAPLRLGLAGGGTDVSPFCDRYGGIVLNATIDRYCYATLEARADRRVVLSAADLDELADFDEDQGGNLTLHRAVYRRIARDFDLGRPALTVTTVADCPPGSGLGSSSTVVVALVEAFREYFSLPLSEYEVARLAFDIERVDCGLKGGRQDQYAATFGGFNVMEFGAGDRAIVNPLRLKPAIVHELEASLVLFHTGVSRESANIIEEQTAHVRSGAADQIEATRVLRREAVAMKEALLTGDLKTLAEVLDVGWQAKKRLAGGISTAAIEETFEVARQGGALAGKLSGAGGGGYIMFLTDPVSRPRLLQYLEQIPGGAVSPVHFVTEGAVAWTLR